jgi:hypothetical protein
LNPDEVTALFQITYSFQLRYGRGFDSAYSRTEYYECSWGGKEWSARKADILTAIFDTTVQKISRHLNPIGVHNLLQDRFIFFTEFQFDTRVL